MPKLAQRQFLTKVAGIDGLWATMSGGEVATTHTKTYDGGALVPDVLTANADITDIVVSRSYDPVRDGVVASTLRKALMDQKAVRTTVTRTPTDEDYTPSGAPEVFEVQLKGVTAPESDANASDAARIQLTFTARSVR